MKKQKSGLYRTRIKVGDDPTGKSIYKYVSGKTKKELEENKQAAIEKHLTGKAPDKMLFGTYALQWFEIRKKPFLAKGTQNLYRSALNRRILPEFADRNLRAITAMQVQKFLNDLAMTGLSTSRISTIRNIMVSIFECAAQDGYITVNPAKHMRVGGTPTKDKHVLTPEERQTIERICATHEDGLILALLYYTGMRCGEARALQWKNVDLKARIIHIEASLKQDDKSYVGDTKTKSSVRDIPILSPLYTLLTSIPRGMPETFVIHTKGDPGKPILADSFRIRYSNIMYAAGLAEVIPEEERGNKQVKYRPIITPHGFRHNFTTMCWESGTLDAFVTAKLLGHSSIKTTMDTYTHLSEKGFEQTADKLENAIVAQLLQSTISKT